jgi:hypothetical protein
MNKLAYILWYMAIRIETMFLYYGIVRQNKPLLRFMAYIEPFWWYVWISLMHTAFRICTDEYLKNQMLDYYVLTVGG